MSAIDASTGGPTALAFALLMVASAMVAGVGAGAAAGATHDPATRTTAVTSVSSCTTITSPGTYRLTTDLTNVGNPVCIDIEASDVVFDGNGHTVDGDGTGETGIRVTGASNVTVRDVRVTDWQLTGIRVEDVNDGAVVNFETTTSSSSRAGVGVALIRTENVRIADGVVHEQEFGILGQDANGTTVNSTDVFDNEGTGVEFSGSQDVRVVSSVVQNNADRGVHLRNSGNVTFENTEVLRSGLSGIDVQNSPNTTFASGTVAHNAEYGIYVNGSDGTTVSNSTLRNNTYSAVDIIGATSVVVEDNEMVRNNGGVGGGRADDALIADNVIRDNEFAGIRLTSTERAEIRDNEVTDNGGDGIHLGELADFNTVANNTALRNNRSGIYTLLGNQTIVDNVANDNRFNGIVVSGEDSTVVNNTVRFNDIDGLRVNAYNGDHEIRDVYATNNTRYDVSIIDGPTTVENVTVDASTRLTVRGRNVGLRSADVQPAPPARTEDVGSYINVSRVESQPQSFADIDVNYTDAEGQALDESGLRVYRHNITWSQVPGTNGVDTTDNYVYANVTSVPADGRVYAPLAPTNAPTRNVSRIGFDYGQYGGNLNIEINGEQLYDFGRFNASRPTGIDGATIGGASVSVTSTQVSGGWQGHVEVTGDIASFRVGGQEMWIDNVEFGPNSNPDANVTFGTLSPSKSRYNVTDTFSSDGVGITVEEFIFADGEVYRNGVGIHETTAPARSGGTTPDFYPRNVNLRFNVTSAVLAASEEPFDFGVELEQTESVDQGNDTNVSAFVNNRANVAVSNTTVELLVDTDSDGQIEPSEVVASRTADFAAGEGREVPITYENVQLAPGQYEYAARISKDGQSTWSFTNGTLTVNGSAVAGASANVSRIGFDYGEYGGNVNIEVNGDQLYNISRFGATPPTGVDGATVGGATVSVTRTAVSGGYQGHVEITGDIEQFRVGGQELWIDNVEFGPASNPSADVTFTSLSPSRSQYTVGDTFVSDGVSVRVEEFLFSDGTTYRNGVGQQSTATPPNSGGTAPDFNTDNVNLAFNISTAVSGGDQPLDADVELEGSETVAQGGDVNVSAGVTNRAGGPGNDWFVELLVDTDGDGQVEAGGSGDDDIVATRMVDIPAGETREVDLAHENVGLEPGEYEYAVRVSSDGQSVRSSTTGTLTVTSGTVADANVSRIGFDYGQYGGNLNIEVNGDQLYNITRFNASQPTGVDGATVGGATVSVTSTPVIDSGVTIGWQGHVEVTGDIEQFRVGGQEMFIDNVEFGPASNPRANVTFDSPSPNKTRYNVTDTFTSQGVGITVEEFIWSGGQITRSGVGIHIPSANSTAYSGGVPKSGGTFAEFYPNNVNLAFDIGSIGEEPPEQEPEDRYGNGVVVDTDGLRNALTDWSSGALSTQELIEVIRAWAQGG